MPNRGKRFEAIEGAKRAENLALILAARELRTIPIDTLPSVAATISAVSRARRSGLERTRSSRTSIAKRPRQACCIFSRPSSVSARSPSFRDGALSSAIACRTRKTLDMNGDLRESISAMEVEAKLGAPSRDVLDSIAAREAMGASAWKRARCSLSKRRISTPPHARFAPLGSPFASAVVRTAWS